MFISAQHTSRAQAQVAVQTGTQLVPTVPVVEVPAEASQRGVEQHPACHPGSAWPTLLLDTRLPRRLDERRRIVASRLVHRFPSLEPTPRHPLRQMGAVHRPRRDVFLAAHRHHSFALEGSGSGPARGY